MTPGVRGAAIAFGWAFAEATVWPFMPDAVLVPLALRRPASWWQLVLSALMGTALGGWVSYRAGRQRPQRHLIERLPLVRPAMIGAAASWLEQDGTQGVFRQASTGIPFKVFARVAGARRLRLVSFLGWAAAGRSVRFALLAGSAALIGARFPALVARRYWLLTGLWAAGFGLALWRVVRFWEDQAS